MSNTYATDNLTIVEAMGYANGHDAAADFFLYDHLCEHPIDSNKMVNDLLDPVNAEHVGARIFLSLEAEPDHDEVEEMLTMVATKLGTGFDATAVSTYCKAFEFGFTARVLRDAVAWKMD